MAYFEAGLCLASTYLGYRSTTPPNKPPKEIFASEKDIGNSLLHKTLIFWRVFPTISGLAQTYFLLKYSDASIPWRREFNIGMILMISGGLLRVWSYRTLDKFFTFELSVSEEQKIIDKGPYGLVRHPSYLALLPYLLGNFFCFTGPFNLFCSLLPTRTVDLGALGNLHSSLSHPSIQTLVRSGLAVFSTFTSYAFIKAFITRIPEEEEMLISKLPHDYSLYKQKVPYRLIPYLW